MREALALGMPFAQRSKKHYCGAEGVPGNCTSVKDYVLGSSFAVGFPSALTEDGAFLTKQNQQRLYYEWRCINHKGMITKERALT